MNFAKKKAVLLFESPAPAKSPAMVKEDSTGKRGNLLVGSDALS